MGDREKQKTENMKIAIIFATGSYAFTRGVDYDVSCSSDGIHVTSSSSSFVLTDKTLPKNKDECKEQTHWNSYGGSIFVPSCLNIKENDKFWNGIIITRKEGPRKWKSETLFIECDPKEFSDYTYEDFIISYLNFS